MFRYEEIREAPNKTTVLMLLGELERRGMIWSKLETSLDGKRTERVWYGYQSSKESAKSETNG